MKAKSFYKNNKHNNMDPKEKENINEEELKEQTVQDENGEETTEKEEVALTEEEKLAQELEKANAEIEDQKDKYLRLSAEFDNYRKRTLREKSELIKNGGESALTHLLPVVDDFERALQNIRSAEDIKAVTEGVELIYSKFMSYLSHQNVKPIETVGEPFDAETSEAVAMIPAPEPDMKGKVLDCVQTGYSLNDKVIRHAKVVVGE